MPLKNTSLFSALLLVFMFTSAFYGLASPKKQLFSVKDYGAKGDGTSLDTKAIQATIDAAAGQGGGTVVLPPGKYLSGTIILKDHILLRIEAGAVLLGSTDMKDYPENIVMIDMVPGTTFSAPLVYAERARYVGIEGKGMIDGQGTRLNFPPLPAANYRPGLIRFNYCQFVTMEDIHLTRPARWTVHLRDSEDITIRNISIQSRSNRNNDGIDIDGCQRVKITGCTIDTEDDAIVLKSYRAHTVRDIVVANCILTSWCYAFKIGTETLGNVENVSVSNCVIYESHGIALQSMDGAQVRNVTISNITMNDCFAVLELRLGGRMRVYASEENDVLPTVPGKMENIIITNIQADNVAQSFDYICGIPGYPVEKVVLDNIRIRYKGGGKKEDAYAAIDDKIKDYPKWTLFGTLPSYGFFIRHAQDISISNLHLSVQEPDYRPALHCEKVTGLSVASSSFMGHLQGAPVIRLINTQEATIRHSTSSGPVATFIGIEGAASADTYLDSNYPAKAKQYYQVEKEVLQPKVR
ncbi:polygalacturonase [Rhabdobacter roseus]|uniref:Polygalacturonase n=1 Tax=Rhabdobacter roseus TaxID=1655419 RepID=A0A840TVG0_9BACT|nr:glycoside hydrolase family 28 protein [Rhabdobacter roseus]MBB5287234.1 polygalacturonase [Rhabdobacter roseus]